MDSNLLIHIRSGDIFRVNPHPKYLPPPLIYYIKVIERVDSKNIRLISEDCKNPVVGKLLELYPSIHFHEPCLDDDIQYVINANNICFSVGSFIPSLLLFNQNIRTIFRSTCHHRNFFHDKNFEIIEVDLGEYKKKMGVWENSDRQRSLLLDYNFN